MKHISVFWDNCTHQEGQVTFWMGQVTFIRCLVPDNWLNFFWWALFYIYYLHEVKCSSTILNTCNGFTFVIYEPKCCKNKAVSGLHCVLTLHGIGPWVLWFHLRPCGLSLPSCMFELSMKCVVETSSDCTSGTCSCWPSWPLLYAGLLLSLQGCLL